MTLNEYLGIREKHPDPGCNESYHEHYAGEEEDFFRIREYNRALVREYPFLLPMNRWTGEIAENYDFGYTELDAMEDGWRIAFSKEFMEELKGELIRYQGVGINRDSSRTKREYIDFLTAEFGSVEHTNTFLYDFHIIQIKEKYGGLRFYIEGAPEGSRVDGIISKYESMSERICGVCGKPARYLSMGWIYPWCEDCKNDFEKQNKERERFRPIDPQEDF